MQFPADRDLVEFARVAVARGARRRFYSRVLLAGALLALAVYMTGFVAAIALLETLPRHGYLWVADIVGERVFLAILGCYPLVGGVILVWSRATSRRLRRAEDVATEALEPLSALPATFLEGRPAARRKTIAGTATVLLVHLPALWGLVALQAYLDGLMLPIYANLTAFFVASGAYAITWLGVLLALEAWVRAPSRRGDPGGSLRRADWLGFLLPRLLHPELLLEAGRFDEAERLLLASVESAPSERLLVEGLVLLGRVRMGFGRPEEAARCFEAALRIDGSPEACAGLAAAITASGGAPEMAARCARYAEDALCRAPFAEDVGGRTERTAPTFDPSGMP